MSSFGEFGELVLLIGDYHIPTRKQDLPPCFKDLLSTDKIRHVLCTGNVGSQEVVDSLNKLASSVHIVKGDFDQDFNFPESIILDIGEFKIGLLHGHQVIPWGESDALLSWQRKLGCDILISGHTHINSVTEEQGHYFVNPGSVTGAPTPTINPLQECVPSFMLMAVQGSNVILYTYEEHAGKSNVEMHEFQKGGNVNDAANS
eukprot:Platyproteum_vivax@DN16742_c0_g1_i1.p1